MAMTFFHSTPGSLFLKGEFGKQSTAPGPEEPAPGFLLCSLEKYRSRLHQTPSGVGSGAQPCAPAVLEEAGRRLPGSLPG